MTTCRARIRHACEGAFGEDAQCELTAPHPGQDHLTHGSPIDPTGNYGWMGVPELTPDLPVIRWRTVPEENL